VSLDAKLDDLHSVISLRDYEGDVPPDEITSSIYVLQQPQTLGRQPRLL
jgi:hypothetical protein